MKKSTILIFLWIIGLFFIIVATVNFSIRIPNIDNSINENQNEIDLFYSNNNGYESNEQTAFLSWRLLTLLKKMGYDETDSDYKSLYENVLVLKRQSLINLELLKTNQVYVPELTEKWSKMDFDELEKEKVKYTDAWDRLVELYSNRDELTKQKQSLLFWTVFFQILGLVLTQFGIVLQLKWKL